MATVNESLNLLLRTDGAVAAALVDSNSGMMLGGVGTGMDLELAAAGNTEVVRSKMQTMKSLGLNDTIEDILITLSKQYHIIRPVQAKAGIFIYLVLDRAKANLAMARYSCQHCENSLSFQTLRKEQLMSS
jgi:predicted regulator of Ras-like GTPase activity (Roadblock/LC7/MglB family)